MLKSKIKNIFSWVFWIAASLWLLSGVVSYFLRSPGTVDFHLHKSRYERIIAVAKAMGIAPGANNHFWITPDLEPVPPDRIIKHSDMLGMVDVARDDVGGYRVSIVTSDEGYSGTFGYIFADGPLFFPDNSTGLTSVQRQLATHWWTGYNGKW
jgi:hypothetical protein